MRFGNLKIAIFSIFWTSLLISASKVSSQELTRGELIRGLWAESLAYDPFSDRPVQLWLPEGTLIYDIKLNKRDGASSWKYRAAKTYHGYPVYLRLRRSSREWNFKKLRANNRPNRFRLNQSVFCPGETSPIVWLEKRCIHGDPVGEGWTFDFLPEPDNPSEPKSLLVTAVLDEETKRNGGFSKKTLQFRLFERDLDFFENIGLLFRLDRPHPINSFNFLGEFYFPCNTEQISEIKEEQIQKLYAEASVEASVGFWAWFKATLKGGVGYEDKDTSIKITRTKINSSKSSIFQLWGVMNTVDDGYKQSTPFLVEKKFECQPNVGTNDPGSKILSVHIHFWNHDEDTNDVFEFNRPSDFMEIDQKLYDSFRRPVFISANSSDDQSAIIKLIMSRHSKLSFNQAIFVFSQLNNRCLTKDIKNCMASVKLKQ